jgi:hypothetical protein
LKLAAIGALPASGSTIVFGDRWRHGRVGRMLQGRIDAVCGVATTVPIRP